MRGKYIAVALALVVAVVVGRIEFFGSAKPSAQAGRQGFGSQSNSDVAALGRVEPRSEIINLGAGTPADRLDSLLVARGDMVKRGQPLGYLAGYAEQMAEHEFISAQLDEAKRKLAAQIELDQLRISAAELKLRQVSEIMPSRISAQESIVESLDVAFGNDKEILSAQLALAEKGATTQRLRDNQQTLVGRDQADLNGARAKLSELRHQFELDRADAEIQLAQARAGLERDKAEIPVVSLERQLGLTEARARKLTLFAPVDGRILNIMVRPGEQVGNNAVLTMGDTSVMRVVAEVYETDIGRVEIGQSARVTSRALAQPVNGKVVRIGNMVFKNDVLNVDPAARADARVVEVWIELDDAKTTERLTNLTVDVLISGTVEAEAQPAARP
ncbi:efflux RND transporter periplasmic adaptor subunit [Bradyrhizobium erythrophlei]|uniref:HlyD family secretion protein n=1 Tax=Bradyrhizobium erythrophlei TaxID=1437360 RepID=A0A1M7SZA3_9BRAD|nr:HlyD family efflux transporter periplasmic adaptor subunit [Bradyrhizobium erythrophlei]SHN63825.1 HlyD family secretion protein [Bradyrhizobium erythrophlei]